MKIYDAEGAEKDLAWLTAKYGDVSVYNSGSDEYEVLALCERVDTWAGVMITVLDEYGDPIKDVQVVEWYSTAPELPDGGWENQGVMGPTNVEGNCGFGWGEDSWYSVKEHGKGPHKIWLHGEGKSEMVDGIGMLALTNHDHLDIVFGRKVDVDPPQDEDVEVFDFDGDQITWSELQEYFGGVSNSKADAPCYNLSHVYVRKQPVGVPDSPMMVQVVDGGLPVEGVPVVLQYVNARTEKCTDALGFVQFDIPRDWHQANTDPTGNISVGIEGHGGLVGARRLWRVGISDLYPDCVFEWVDEDDSPPDPEPDPEFKEVLLAVLDEILVELKRLS